ncbi:peptide chain release factor N(5)-glutamine methyltransferase [Pendulispora rubella]|uniref:Release factor glutamine methyltransferase n=1 Tax=Pendulispora rubella TaxID=2741070 RepID=A0ABZ2L0E2_9BACT
MKETWTIEAVVRWATDDFRARGIESPRLDAEVLLAFALDTDRVRLIVDARRPLEADELARFRELVKRRRKHEPVAFLRGEREFFGRPFRVDARVLIPRPDTEVLVQVALERTRHVSLSMRALDLCTGSGCVAISLGRERPTAQVLASDISEGALAVARDNAHRLGAFNVGWASGDLFGALASRAGLRFDVVTANPPYIPSEEIATLAEDIRSFEPILALDGGQDGLDLLRRIVQDAPAFLVDGGVLAVEVGAGEAPDVGQLFEQRGFEDVRIARDYGGIERVVSGAWPAGMRVLP